MTQFRPFFWLTTSNTEGGVYIEYKTYTELKKNIQLHLENSIEDCISVFRSRRGQWGEWFEHWELVDDKPTIIKEGWM